MPRARRRRGGPAVARGGADVDGRTATGRTAVTAAALGDHVEVARVLIDAGADVDLQDDDRNNPLLVCGETGDVAMLREVLRGEPDLGATNRFGGDGADPRAATAATWTWSARCSRPTSTSTTSTTSAGPRCWRP